MAEPERGIVFQLLERDLVEWAEDTSLRLVWADLLQLHDDRRSQDGSRKLLFKTATGALVESVILPAKRRVRSS